VSKKKKQTTTSYKFRSGLEEHVADQLDQLGVSFEYETLIIKFIRPSKMHRYTPDFILPNKIIIETKGRFLTKDRQKHLLVKKQNPDLDIRFVFSNPNQKISKTSKTTYAMWCESKGFLYAKQTIPTTWLKEKSRPKEKIKN
tara:strand:+ start:348 stop:773 length:426 start_codon:yes stop_codon:yes gene_type:complete